MLDLVRDLTNEEMRECFKRCWPNNQAQLTDMPDDQFEEIVRKFKVCVEDLKRKGGNDETLG